ncbi:alpha/beta hydrolase family protein [Microbacterium sp. CPCC 204701]|uniref:alpha/beta hydrolase family protein n=1 Tax=Microbacterium sp. CPCC 204701 TaxID=2493084 RepID=UPI0013E35595|nr:acetylxylan esterase [Microbacterium sp. CPCC 204701]
MSTLLSPSPPFLGFVGGDSAIQLERHIDLRTRALEHEHRGALADLATRDSIDAYRERVRKHAVRSLGGPLPRVGEVRSCKHTDEHVDGLVVETLQLRDERNVIIPITTLRPRDLPQKSPAILVLPGHSARTSSWSLDLSATIASAGFVVAVLEVWGQGERSEYRDSEGRSALDIEPGDVLPVLEHNWGGTAAWVVGDSVARHLVQDARVALSYLRSRPDVYPDKVGVTGASGGGLLTTWLMLIEPSIAAAAPLIFITDQEHIRSSGIPQCAEQVALGDGEAWIDHVDALIAMAPRPVLVGSGDYDFFPVDGAIATVAQGRAVYATLGAHDALEHHRFASGHAVPAQMREAVADFFAKRLGRRGKTSSQEREWSAERLASTRTGFVTVDDPESVRLPHLAARRLVEKQRAATAESTRIWLAERILRPERVGEPHVRWTGEESLQLGPEAVRRRAGFWPVDEGVDAAGILIEPSPHTPDAVVIALFDRGTDDLASHEAWVRERLDNGEAVFAVDVRGTGSLMPRTRNWFPMDGNYGTQYELLINLFRIGDSLGAGRAYDVVRSIEVAGEYFANVRLESWGFANAYAVTAAVVDGRIAVRTHGPVLDAATFITPYPTSTPRDWQQIIPGQAVHAPRAGIEAALGERWTPVGVHDGGPVAPAHRKD